MYHQHPGTDYPVHEFILSREHLSSRVETEDEIIDDVCLDGFTWMSVYQNARPELVRTSIHFFELTFSKPIIQDQASPFTVMIEEIDSQLGGTEPNNGVTFNVQQDNISQPTASHSTASRPLKKQKTLNEMSKIRNVEPMFQSRIFRKTEIRARREKGEKPMKTSILNKIFP